MTILQKVFLYGGIGSAVIASLYFLKGCNSGTVTTISTNITSAPVTTIKSDSTTIRQQEVVILQSQATIQAMEDSLELLTEKLTQVKPEYIIRYRDTLTVHDSVSYAVQDTRTQDSLRSLLMASTAAIDSFIYSKKWIPVPRSFSDSNAFFSMYGTVSYSGLDLSKLRVYNNTSVIIGQKSTLFSTGPVVVNVAESSPLLSSGTLQTYFYQPKVRKWTLVGGPAIIFNGKSFTQGIGLMAGYKIF